MGPASAPWFIVPGVRRQQAGYLHEQAGRKHKRYVIFWCINIHYMVKYL